MPGSGEGLSKTYCTSCHLYPEPSLLDKKTWKNHVSGENGSLSLGIFNDNIRYYDEDAEAVVRAGLWR